MKKTFLRQLYSCREYATLRKNLTNRQPLGGKLFLAKKSFPPTPLSKFAEFWFLTHYSLLLPFLRFPINFHIKALRGCRGDFHWKVPLTMTFTKL